MPGFMNYEVIFKSLQARENGENAGENGENGDNAVN
jgi:hypothetical protein